MYVKALKPFIFLMTVLALVSLACLGSTETPSPEPPAETEAPAQPEQPQETEAPAQASAQEFFKEEFDGDLSNWTYFNVLGSDSTNESGLSLETDGGYLVFDISTKQLYTYVTYDPYEYKNVAIALRAENRGTNNNAVTLVCRSSDEGWYEIAIENSGLYKIWAATYRDNGDIIYNKLADGGSTKIKVGKETNEYKMVCKERSITLFINGFETRVYEDNTYVLRDGLVGFSVQSFNDPTVKVEVDWVEISQP